MGATVVGYAVVGAAVVGAAVVGAKDGGLCLMQFSHVSLHKLYAGWLTIQTCAIMFGRSAIHWHVLF